MIRRPLILALLVAALFAGTMLAPPRAAAEVSVSVSFSVFHRSLAPYGRWVSVAGYGECWHPTAVAATWAPYTDGQWAYTDYGWTWVSDDPFADYPFHYGSWVWVDGYGWIWVPGTVWAPAWVTWCDTDDFIGWAPLPPSFAIGFEGYRGDPVTLPASRYVFVPATRFVGTRVSSVRVDPASNARIFARAHRVTVFSVSGGIVHDVGLPVSRVRAIAHARISPRALPRLRAAPARMSAPGRSRRVSLVMPSAERRLPAASSRSAASSARRVARRSAKAPVAPRRASIPRRAASRHAASPRHGHSAKATPHRVSARRARATAPRRHARRTISIRGHASGRVHRPAPRRTAAPPRRRAARHPAVRRASRPPAPRRSAVRSVSRPAAPHRSAARPVFRAPARAARPAPRPAPRAARPPSRGHGRPTGPRGGAG